MLKFFEWLMKNWRILITISLIIFLFTLIVPLTNSIRSAKAGIKETTTPLGFFVLISLIALAIFLIWFFKSKFDLIVIWFEYFRSLK